MATFQDDAVVTAILFGAASLCVIAVVYVGVFQPIPALVLGAPVDEGDFFLELRNCGGSPLKITNFAVMGNYSQYMNSFCAPTTCARDALNAVRSSIVARTGNDQIVFEGDVLACKSVVIHRGQTVALGVNEGMSVLCLGPGDDGTNKVSYVRRVQLARLVQQIGVRFTYKDVFGFRHAFHQLAGGQSWNYGVYAWKHNLSFHNPLTRRFFESNYSPAQIE